MKNTTNALPVITDEHLTLVEFHDHGPDSMGRRSFSAYWLADNVGPALNETGTRGQVFRANVAEFTASAEARHMRVEIRPAQPAANAQTATAS